MNSISNTQVKTATIAAAGTLSGAIDMEEWKYAGVVMPAVWATAGMTFAVCNKADGTFLPLYDSNGIEVSATVAASKATSLDSVALALAPWRFVKLRSGTVGTAVAQAGPKATVVLTPAATKTLTFTSGVGGTLSNSITIAMTTAADDVLAVTNVGPAITIAVAKTTAANNSAANIQTAIRTLTVSGVTMTGFTVTGSTEYDSAPVTSATVAATALAGGNDTLIEVVLKG